MWKPVSVLPRLLVGERGQVRQGEAAGADYRARLNAERAAGRPSSCPPKGTKVSSDKLLAFLRTYPEAHRPRTSMKQAIGDFFARNYPCT